MTSKEIANQNFDCNICQSHFDVPGNEFINHLKAHAMSKTCTENLIQNAAKHQNTQELECDICEQNLHQKLPSKTIL